jgi:hypothetical protein
MCYPNSLLSDKQRLGVDRVKSKAQGWQIAAYKPLGVSGEPVRSVRRQIS